MNRIPEPLARSAQIARKTLPGVLLALGLSSCDRDSPTEAKRTVPAPDSAWVTDVAGFAIALQDVQSRILPARSEEHTSELQSPCNLVCRLLLEKKKHNDRQ